MAGKTVDEPLQVGFVDGDLATAIDSEGWFRELHEMWPGEARTLKVKQLLYSGKSDFQHVVVFESETYGTTLVLDGAIQLTQRDEFAYHEMIAHVALCAHPEPKKVMIVGGGDGGVLREVLKHACVESVVLCDIDSAVVRASKTFFPFLAPAFADPRLTLVIDDAAKYLCAHESEFDVIISDSSDPIGPAAVLFGMSFTRMIASALRPGGIAITQGESQWLHLDVIRELLGNACSLFEHVEYCWSSVPTYPSGNMGFAVLRKAGGYAPGGCARPRRELPAAQANELRYYSPAIHAACFALPAFAQRALAAVLRP